MEDTALESKLSQLHEKLAATRERPIEREASRWIGEADAIAADLADATVAELDDAVVWKRVGHVADLLSNVEQTGDDAADEHVAAARDVADAILELET